jgi:CubicO group peptidase (beta-lactamase class C family)
MTIPASNLHLDVAPPRHPGTRRIGPVAAAATAAALTMALLTGSGTSPAPAPASGPAPAILTPAQAMDAYLSRLVNLHQFRGAITVARGTDVLLSKGYGLANASTAMPITPHTRFRIASVTKQFTALAILKLQELGKLMVTDHVCRYVPACPAAWKAITIEHLLTHTSGMPTIEHLQDYAVTRGPLSPEQLIGLFRDRETAGPPGVQFRYSNYGYMLLGYVIERVTGGTYAKFLRQQILDPLGMSESGYDVTHPDPQTHAVGYWTWDFRTTADWDMSIPFSAGAMYASTSDLYRWNRFLLAGKPKILDSALLAQMFVPRVPLKPGGPDASAASRRQIPVPDWYWYGYGWVVYGPTDVMYAHEGGIDGFAAFNLIEPRRQLSITILSNQHDVDVGGIALALLKITIP